MSSGAFYVRESVAYLLTSHVRPYSCLSFNTGAMFFVKILATMALLVTAVENDQHSSHNDEESAHLSEVQVVPYPPDELHIHLKYPNEAYFLVSHVAETYFRNCGIVYVYGGRSRSKWKSNSLLRSLSNVYWSYEIFETNASVITNSDATRDVTVNKLRETEERETCRVFICDITDATSPSPILNFLQRAQLFLIPRAAVLFLGPESFLHSILEDGSLMNTINALYLVEETPNKKTRNIAYAKQYKEVSIYSRCLFCQESGPGIEFINIWNSNYGLLRDTPLFKDQFRDFQGHKMRIVQMDWYPLIAYKKVKDETSNLVIPVDSVHVRMLEAVANALNFTYEMRNPWDCQVGISTESGNWTGMVGTLQHHKADFGLSLTYNLGRMKVVDYSRIVLKEPMLLVTSKATPTPQYLALIRPLTADLWIILSVLSVSSGVILWGLQVAWKKVSGRPGLSYDVSSLYTWCTLFEEPALKLPTDTPSLIFVGSWCIFCTFMTAMYKSSLIAYLTVPGKADSIDSFEEMLKDGGWTWGYKDNNSNPYELLRTGTSPVIKRIFEGLEVQTDEEQIERLLKGKHAIITKEFLFKSLKATMGKIRRGVSPFHYGRLEYLVNGDGWAFRQNAPFYNAIDLKLQRLVETGHINRWLKDLVGTTQEDCGDLSCGTDTEDEASEGLPKETSGQVVLNLNHLQSAFYVFLLGLAVASLAFITEVLFGKHSLSDLQDT